MMINIYEEIQTGKFHMLPEISRVGRKKSKHTFGLADLKAIADEVEKTTTATFGVWS